MKKLWWMLIVSCMALAPRVEAAPLKVVATLSTFADLVEAVGGEHVVVETIASPRFNPHFIEPKPSDVLKVKRADLFVHAGLDLELWRFPLVDAAGNLDVRPGGARELDLSWGVALLDVPDGMPTRAEGDIHMYGNPHYWLSPENAVIMVRTIAEKLTEIDPTRASDYHRRADDWTQQLDAAVTRWRSQAAAIRGQEAVAYHNEWPYLAEFLGIRVEHFLEPKPGIPPTPKHLRFLEGYITERGIRAIVQATFVPQGAGRSLAKRTGAQVVPLCHNVRELSACADYLQTMEYNVTQLVNALQRP